jgi:hypothetical protein
MGTGGTPREAQVGAQLLISRRPVARWLAFAAWLCLLCAQSLPSGARARPDSGRAGAGLVPENYVFLLASSGSRTVKLIHKAWMNPAGHRTSPITRPAML